MKSQIISIFIAIIFSITLGFSNNTEPSITTSGTKSFIINKTDWSSDYVHVTITDHEGITIYSNQQELEDSKKYSLENLRSGNYVVTISNDMKTVKNNITITQKEMLIDLEANTIYKPIFKLSKNNIDINYFAAGIDTKIYIQENDRVLHQSNIKNTLSIKKRYNLSNLPSGNYNILVSNKNGSFSKSFIK